ncbi:MAG: sigma-54-dependent transcriptional regulator, partial [Bacteroidia bacterium]
MKNINSEFKIFVVEDNEWYCEMLAHHLSLNPDYHVKKFFSGDEILRAIHENPAIVCLDYSLPDKNGSEILKKIKEFNPDIQVIIISGQEDIGVAVKLLKEGAYDYLLKNEETKDMLWNAINNIRQNMDLKKEIIDLKKEVVKKYDFSNIIIGKSNALAKTFQLIEKAAQGKITVSITGETGTGKELVAKAIHYNSERKNKPFVAVNVTAIPKELIESELFGHEKGAFTGANTRRIGKFEEANGGTLFLDEIAEMDISLQSKLLRALQEHEITRVGSNAAIPVDNRIIVATHKDLAEEVKKGNFREDLYYRLLGLP